jgi:hypothetical protein
MNRMDREARARISPEDELAQAPGGKKGRALPQHMLARYKMPEEAIDAGRGRRVRATARETEREKNGRGLLPGGLKARRKRTGVDAVCVFAKQQKMINSLHTVSRDAVAKRCVSNQTCRAHKSKCVRVGVNCPTVVRSLYSLLLYTPPMLAGTIYRKKAARIPAAPATAPPATLTAAPV